MKANNNNCKTVANQYLEVNTPVKLEAIVDVEDVTVKCCEPKIICNQKTHCNNKYIYEFVVKQKINVEIPISYDTVINTGEGYINCDKPTVDIGKPCIKGFKENPCISEINKCY